MKTLATAAVVFLFFPNPSFGQVRNDAPVIIEYKFGSPVVSGRSIPVPKADDVLFDVVTEDNCEAKLAKVSEQIDRSRGDFTIRLANSLKAGTIRICQTVRTGGADEVRLSVEYPVSDPNSNQYWINLEQERPIREGTEKLSGTVGAAVKSVRLLVYSPIYAPSNNGLANSGARKPAAHPNTKELNVSELGAAFYSDLVEFLNRDASGERQLNDRREYLARAVECAIGELEQVMEVPVANGRFETAFKRPIEAGQCIIARASFPDGHVYAEGPDVEFVRPGFADWGRMRGIFALGTAIGNSRGRTQADPYISFYADASVMNRLLRRSFAPTENDNVKTQDANGTAQKMFHLKGFSYGLHFFSEARLTQSAKQETSDAGAQAQALFFQAGFYAPFRVGGMDWRHKGQVYSFFLAPLAKYGSLWLRDGVVTRETTTDVPADTGRVTGLAVPARSSTEQAFNKGSHPFYGYGGRLGFFRYDLIGKVPRNRQMAPELIGYLDFTYGQNSSFRTPFLYSTKTASNRVVTSVTGYRTDPRFQVEGRVKLPAMPVQLGVDWNLNSKRPDRSATELRFIVAFRTDAARAIGRALGSK